MEATGTEPTASAHAVAPPGSAIRSWASRADLLSFHSRGVANELTIFVEGHHAVLLAANGRRRPPSRRAGSAVAS